MISTCGAGTRGIIPAYAGSTGVHGHSLSQGADHPRIRGEHAAGAGDVLALTGSSPHTRGARAGYGARRQLSGIIPAYAGSTCTSRPPGALKWDHPRIRGEHLQPRMRAPRQSRIIPAYAGSTSKLLASSATMRDHPRIRGEHPDRSGSSRPAPGSSPHTRGARLQLSDDHLVHGIIPAYAGSTRESTSS